MATTVVRCPSCQAAYRVEDALLGKKGRCKTCQTTFLLAVVAETAPSVPATEAIMPVAPPETTPSSVVATSPPPQTGRMRAEDGVFIDWQADDIILELYEIRGVLGEGGMGTVYRVHHRGWNLELAVKSLKPDRRAEAGWADNFEREAEAWVNLGLHPHTVSCYYVRRLGGLPRVFAEYVEGGSLHDAIVSGRLYAGGPDAALPRLLDAAIQFAWGLHHAHERGLIHQDVKPANVMLTPDGAVKVTDFGLARARAAAGEGDHAGRHGQTVVVAGAGLCTREYASPEQLEGQPLTRRTDVWSWAVSVLETFCQTHPVIGTAAPDLLESYLADDPPQDVPRMPTGLVELLRRCLRTEPAARPGDMLEVTAALREVYRQATGGLYPREEPRSAEALANSLNNQAVSLLDLGRAEEAEVLWERALQAQPQHPESTYNLGLARWRSGRMTDDAIERQLRVVAESRAEWLPRYLLGLIHLERGDREAAGKVLAEIRGLEADLPEVKDAVIRAGDMGPGARRLLRGFEAGHRGSVNALALSADGRLAVSGGADCTVRVWDVATGKCVRTIKTHEPRDYNEVVSVSVSADSRLALSAAGREQNFSLWDTSTGAIQHTFEADKSAVLAVYLTPDGGQALAGSADGLVRLWDVRTRRVLQTFKGHSRVEAVCLSADGRFALTGGGGSPEHPGGELRYWDVGAGRCLRTFEGSFDPVHSVSLRADARWALAGSEVRLGGDVGEVKLWDTATGQCLRTFVGHTAGVSSVWLSPDGRRALSGSGPGQSKDVLRLWDTATGQCLCTFHDENTAKALCLSPDARCVLTGHGVSYSQRTSAVPGTIKLWEVDAAGQGFPAPAVLCRAVKSEVAAGAEEAYRDALERAGQAMAGGDPVTAAASVREARAVEGCGRRPEALGRWQGLYVRLRRKGLLGAWEGATWTDHKEEVMSISLSPDGRQALTASGRYDSKWNAPPEVRLWDVASGTCLRTLEGYQENFLRAVCLSGDGRHVLAAAGKNLYSGTFWVWELATGQLRSGHHPHKVTSVCASPDGRYALSADGGDYQTPWQIKLWELPAVRCLRTRKAQEAFPSLDCLALSPDGRHFLAACGDKVDLWDFAAGQSVRPFQESQKGASAVCYSADGRHALGGCGNALLLWEVATGRVLGRCTGHERSITSVALTGDGRFAFSAADKTIKGWDLDSGQCLCTLTGHAEQVNCIALSPDARYLLSGSDDRTVKVWLLDWELDDNRPADWDEAARPFLDNFLTLHTPYAAALPEGRDPTDDEVIRALTREGQPQWTEEDFGGLLRTLGRAGFGWLRPEGVRRELEKAAAAWQGPPPLA